MELTQPALIALMKFRPSLSETAVFFNVSEDTVSRRIASWENITFSDFRLKHSFNVKQKLINKALEMASTGNVPMLIFCLKNYAGWADKLTEATAETKTTVSIAFNPALLKKR